MTTTRRARRPAPADPQVPGGRYLCGYWQQEYDVLAMWQRTDSRGWTYYLVRWSDGRIGQHCTQWDAKHDRVIAQPS